MAGPAILIVENIGYFRETVRELLERLGYKVTEARLPAEAENEVALSHFAAAVMDVRLRDDLDRFDSSGITLARKLGEKVPVIILTAYDDTQAIEQAYTIAPGAPRIRAFISKNDSDWDTRLITALEEITQKKGGISEWVRTHWQALATTVGEFLIKLHVKQ